MQLEKLSLSELAFNTEAPFQEVLGTPDNFSVEYFMWVNLSYPPGLHDDHHDFRLALTKDIVEEEVLGDYQLYVK